jgi:hypothetical protein
MTRIVEIDPREITITPVFKMMNIENVPKSERAGHLVMEMHECVEVRFAGSKNYSPIFPAGAFSRREGNAVITYAERWPEQYRQFKEGNPQEANGTPLEMLRPYNITPEALSLCRALKIYSIEALHHLEGTAAKSLGMSANKLKDAARQFMADRASNSGALDELETLKARIAELESASTRVPAADPKPEEIEAAVATADAAYQAMEDPALKDLIRDRTGIRPAGNPSRDTLLRTLKELDEAA